MVQEPYLSSQTEEGLNEREREGEGEAHTKGRRIICLLNARDLNSNPQTRTELGHKILGQVHDLILELKLQL
jgi:hypothetical protein